MEKTAEILRFVNSSLCSMRSLRLFRIHPFGAGIWARHSIHIALSGSKLSHYPLTAGQLNCRS